MNKKIFLILTVLFLMLSESLFAQDDEVSIAYILESGNRSKIAKYLFKDTKQGMKKYKKSVSIQLIDIRNANNTLFKNYDVVVVINEKNIKTLNKNVKDFIDDNKKEQNLIVVAFLPRRSSKLQDTQGVDVLSSASEEDPAAHLVKTDLTEKINQMVETKQSTLRY